MIVLGISAFYHDSAAAIIKNGDIIAAAQEERFTRLKHDSSFPGKAIDYCLNAAQISLKDVDSIVFFEKPLVKFERLVETYLSVAPKGFASFKKAMPIWLHEKFFQKRLLVEKLAGNASRQEKKAIRNKLLFSDHHLSHAASAFFPSPFEEAVVLTLDGVGEWASSSVGVGKGNALTIEKEINFPHSLGLLYSAFTAYLGFRVNSGEYKVMGLAPYGTPKYAAQIMKNMVDVKEDGSFRLEQSYFDYAGGLSMYTPKFCALFGVPARAPEAELTQFHMDIAASVQAATEDIISRMVHALSQQYHGIENLCLAGGVALNCVANGRIMREGHFKNIWVQPAAGDSGGALGAALAGYYLHHKGQRDVFFGGDSMKAGLLGPSFTDQDIQSRLESIGAVVEKRSDIVDDTVKALSLQKAVGWFQGAMEYGPRALGARSILADARSPTMQKDLNLKIKFRESFRPFAPSVLGEEADNWFDLKSTSPYMMFTAPVSQKKRGQIPAVTHVDFSARVQTVSAKDSPLYHALLKRFHQLTGCPIILNTSFNVRGEPIVCTPEDAFRCFMGCDLDMLVIGNYVLHKERQDQALRHDHKNRFVAD